MGNTSGVWADIVRSLNGSATALCWDLRGHGRSERSQDPEDYARKFAVADLATMIAHAGGSADNPAVLVGHSLGGYLSLCAAIQYPRLVKALVLIATGPGFRDADGSRTMESICALHGHRCRCPPGRPPAGHT